ncbi:MAG TPA: hypothetical protein VM282_19500 [Acidimicrobiales bacterium]|nr:hypothetical protein [Acidimicrobiales bacterium]
MDLAVHRPLRDRAGHRDRAAHAVGRQYERIVAEIETAGAAPSAQVGATLDAILKKQGALGGSLHVLTVVILYLMVWKPGA